MAQTLNRLSDVKARSKLKAGRHADGGGLYLNVTATGAKSWVFLWMKEGKRREMGLGSYPATTLAAARSKAEECRQIVASGGNPIESRQKETPQTFGECADAFVASMEDGWRNDKHIAQWKMTLTDYCAPIRNKSVADIGTDDILTVLNPIWQTKAETASRLRGRLERVLDFAKVKGWRTGENPALWRGHLRNVLPQRKKLTRGHHAAMPYKDVPDFVAHLQGLEALSARALELLILTAARSGEILLARTSEFDLNEKLWTVPADRMKRNRVHRVPLVPRAVEIVQQLLQLEAGVYLFPGQKKDKPLSNMSMQMLMGRMKKDAYTPHGFRSAFRDWVGDETTFAREIVEAALSHAVGNETEQAYRRADALKKRRKMMEAWASYCLRGINS